MENGFLTSAALLEASRKTIKLPSGAQVLIRRVGPMVLIQATGNLPDLASMAAPGKSGGNELATSRAMAPIIEKTLLAGMVEPRLFSDPADGPTPSDFLWPDQLAAFNAILEHSGWSGKAAGEVLPFSGTAG